MRNWLTSYWGACGAVFLLAGLTLGIVFVFWGCSRAASDLGARQKAVQDCILSGGHPRLGPDNTILCI